MKVLKQYAQKHADRILSQAHPEILNEVVRAIEDINPTDVLTKVSLETGKIRRWGGLLLSPPALNRIFKARLLEPGGWLKWDERSGKYAEHGLFFADDSSVRRADRFRKIDGIKADIGLEVQLGKYAFMGYDIFSKMIIFHNKGLINYGIEIVPVQAMVKHMSTGISAFEAILIDFENRGEANIDIPVLVLGIGPTQQEWEQIRQIQEEFRSNPDHARHKYPNIGRDDRHGTKPGPK